MANSITRQALIDEAVRRGWDVSTLGHKAFFLKVCDKRGQCEVFRGSMPMRSSAFGLLCSKYKHLSYDFLTSVGYKLPPYLVVNSVEEAVSFMEKHKLLVVKPVDGKQSEGVSVGISNKSRLTQAINLAKSKSISGEVLLQKQLTGRLYRILVLNDKVVAVSERRAAEVMGDGLKNIAELINELNQNPKRGTETNSPMKKIKPKDAVSYLGTDALERVPAKGESVRVAAIESVSAGGEAINVTEMIHPEWIKVAKDITMQMGLFISGLDIMCEDIALPPDKNELPFLEINTEPGFKIHQYPSIGRPINLAKLVLDEVIGSE